MEVYVQLTQDTTAVNRYELRKAEDGKLLADFDVTRDVDAYVTANGFTYVADPTVMVIDDVTEELTSDKAAIIESLSTFTEVNEVKS
jgi:hypothetical protein